MTTTPDVDPSNADQARAWDGHDGHHWSTHADQYEAVLGAYDADFLAAAGIEAGDRVLDVGCGTGQSTRAAATVAADGSVLGVDLSREMLAVAQQRTAASSFGHVVYQRADAQVHPFEPESFDVVLSRTSAMFFGDCAAAFGNLGRALRPGGRLVLLTWQGLQANEWMVAVGSALAGGAGFNPPPSDRPGPFALSDPDRIRALLDEAGFLAVAVQGLQRPARFGRDVAQAEELLLGQMGWLLKGQQPTTRERSLTALRSTLEQYLTDEGVRFPSGVWLTTAVRES